MNLFRPSQSFLLTSVPDSSAEPDFVDEISQVVDKVLSVLVNGTAEVSEEVTGWVDAPSGGDNESAGTEGFLNVWSNLVDFGSGFTGFTNEDFRENVEPTTQTEKEG